MQGYVVDETKFETLSIMGTCHPLSQEWEAAVIVREIALFRFQWEIENAIYIDKNSSDRVRKKQLLEMEIF